MKYLAGLILFTGVFFSLNAESRFSDYADLNSELMVSSVSASLAGSDLSTSSGSAFGSSPANLPFDSLNNLSLSYANYYQNVFSTSLLSFSGPAGKNGGFGISFGYVYIPNIENTLSSTINENNEIVLSSVNQNSSDIFIRFGYGYRFDLSPVWAVSAGVSANARRTRLIDYTGYGLGLDAGARVYHRISGVSCVIELDNVSSNYTYWSDSYKEYSRIHLKIGLGWEREIPYIYGKIKIGYTTPDLLANEGINFYTTETDTNNQIVETPLQTTLSAHPEILFYSGKLGLEYTIMNRVALRAGVAQGKVSFGAGLKLFSNKAGVDFAYIRHELNETYQVSLLYRW